MSQSIGHPWLFDSGQLGVIIRTRPFKHRPAKIALPKVYTENTAKLTAYVGESNMAETRIGTVTHYYNHLHVAGVTITNSEPRKGDTVYLVT